MRENPKRDFNFLHSVSLFAVLMLCNLETAGALCASQPEDGDWINTDPNTRSISRIKLIFVCQDQILNGRPYPPGPVWSVQIHGRCHPTDCDWGTVGAERLGTDHIFAVFHQGFAIRYVYAKMSQYRLGQLWVYTYTDFLDSTRNDYEVQNWFQLEGTGPPVVCGAAAPNSIASADFDSSAVGSVPLSTSVNGPPGAELKILGAGAIEFVDSNALGSNALRISRLTFSPDGEVSAEAVVGQISGNLNDSGVYYINYRAFGEIVPDSIYSGAAIAVWSSAGQRALSLKLHANTYHVLEGGSYFPLEGSYNPSVAHSVHIEVNLDARTYSICIDDETVASNRPLLASSFGGFHSLKFFSPLQQLEAFEMSYVVDDIRITKQ